MKIFQNLYNNNENMEWIRTSSMPFKWIFPLVAFLIIPNRLTYAQSSNRKLDQRPNILLLVADDLGYADLGCYGGDLFTPHIDRLAKAGIRFSRFHASPLCAPTRAMLLSGNDNHIAGMGRQGFRSKEFGYEGRLTDRIVTIPQVLRLVGYHTYMAGKWHLGRDSLSNPHHKGFEHSFTMLEGGANHYDDQGIFKDTPISLYTEDGRPAKWKNGLYSTDFYTDKLIEYIDRHKEDDKPFFAFAAYTSPHWPLQVDEKYWLKYKGRYDAGYEKLKADRLQSLKKAGMIPAEAQLPPNHESVKPWDSLSGAQQKSEARKMELYAGMVENLDFNIGRLIQYLKKTGEYNNTLIVFMSDNGAAAEDFYYQLPFSQFIQQHFNVNYKDMGQPRSFISYGPQWAEAGSSPFKYFKGHVTEGGMIAPMIMTGPGVKIKNKITHEFVTLLDVAPTFYEIANTNAPKEFEGKKVHPLKGSSILPFTSRKQKTVHDSAYVFGLEHNGRAMIRKGDWKITNDTPPFRPENFKLYDLSRDLAELHDLKDAEPKKYEELLNEWNKFALEIKPKFPSSNAD